GEPGERRARKALQFALVDREQVSREAIAERRLFLGEALAQIPGPGLDAHQRLDAAPVHQALVDAAAEIEEVGEGAGLARLQDRLDGALSGAAHAAQA